MSSREPPQGGYPSMDARDIVDCRAIVKDPFNRKPQQQLPFYIQGFDPQKNDSLVFHIFSQLEKK